MHSHLDLLGEDSGLVGSLSSLDEDLESVEISKGSSLVVSIHLGESLGGSPLLLEIESLGGLGNGSGSGSSQQGKSKLGQVESLEGVDDSGEVSESINKHSGVVNDVGNDNHLSVVLSVIDVANSAWLHKISESLMNSDEDSSIYLPCGRIILKIN